jgi:hypothetical protein
MSAWDIGAQKGRATWQSASALRALALAPDQVMMVMMRRRRRRMSVVVVVVRGGALSSQGRQDSYGASFCQWLFRCLATAGRHAC